ncbi:hypothetical protein L6452_44120 [Arctium lappa]|uniref:Uncharacterized protein n=1 Tax=Arctium lappa TaxID=4217 RepID=A0ACB8XFB8_ARCLA|nr:hypothetical protein L6452_44120 [Arctium lappa]
MNYHVLLTIGVFLMDSSTEIDARDEEREENMEQISSDSSIGPSEQCNVFEIPTTSEVSHKSNCDSAIDSSKEASRSELPISSENWDSIDDTLNQDVDVSSELLSKIGTSNRKQSAKKTLGRKDAGKI